MAGGTAVIVLNFCGKECLSACLDTLLAQRPVKPKIIVLDPDTGNKSAESIRRKYPEVTVLQIDAAAGPGAAVARGIAAAKQPGIILMNCDTLVRPDWLTGISSYLERLPDSPEGLPKVIYYLDENVLQVVGNTTTPEKSTLSWLQTENADLKAKLRNAMGRLAQTQERTSKLQDAVTKLQEKNRDVSKITYANAINEGMVQNLEQQIRDLQDKLNESSALSDEAGRIRSEKDSVGKKLITANEELAKANRRIANLQKVVEGLRKTAATASANTPDVLSEYKARITELEFSLERREKEYNQDLHERNSELESALDRVAELMILTSKQKSEIASMSAAADENNSLRIRISDLDAALNETRSTLEQLNRDKERIITDSSSLVADLVSNISELTIKSKSPDLTEKEFEDFKDIVADLEERLAQTDIRFEQILKDKDSLLSDTLSSLEAAETKIRVLEEKLAGEFTSPGAVTDNEKPIDEPEQGPTQPGADPGGILPNTESFQENATVEYDTAASSEHFKAERQARTLVLERPEIEPASESRSNEYEVPDANGISPSSSNKSFDDDITGGRLDDSDVPDVLIQNIYDNPSSESFLKFREFFARDKSYENGIRTLISMFAENPREDIIPAVSLLIGEFYMRTGKQEESDYFLSNPMIPKNPLSSLLLNVISLELPAGPVPE